MIPCYPGWMDWKLVGGVSSIHHRGPRIPCGSDLGSSPYLPLSKQLLLETEMAFLQPSTCPHIPSASLSQPSTLPRHRFLPFLSLPLCLLPLLWEAVIFIRGTWLEAETASRALLLSLSSGASVGSHRPFGDHRTQAAWSVSSHTCCLP